jgi:hypothetical protein
MMLGFIKFSVYPFLIGDIFLLSHFAAVFQWRLIGILIFSFSSKIGKKIYLAPKIFLFFITVINLCGRQPQDAGKRPI